MDIQEKKAVIIAYLKERLALYQRKVDQAFTELGTDVTDKRRDELVNTVNHYLPVIKELGSLLREDLS